MKVARIEVTHPITGDLCASIKFVQIGEGLDWVAVVSNEFMCDVGNTSYKGLTVKDTQE